MRRVYASILVLFASCPLAGQESSPRLLIVAPGKLEPGLRTFAGHRSKTLPTDLVTLEAMLAEGKGVDAPERLKRAIFDRWRMRRVAWVLLVGDADVMPVRWMVLDRVTPAAYDYAFYASDLYYADLAKKDGSFEDWNGAKDGFHAGYFGEVRGEKNKKDPINYDRVDYKPEIAVGRWPVSTLEQVRIVAEKTVRRDAAATSRPSWRRRAGTIAVDGWVDGRPALESAAKALGSEWSVEKRHNPKAEEVVRLLDEGCGLVFHTGHGADDQWEKCFSVASMAKLENADRLPVMMSCGCSTARFSVQPPYEGYVDVSGVGHEGTNHGEVFAAPPPAPAPYQPAKYAMTGLGERLLRDGPGGAVAYIGCNTGSQPAGLTLLEGFAKAAGAGKCVRLGDCWRDAVAYYFDAQNLATITPTPDWYPASIFFQGMKFMLFGDPTLEL
jgi:hypothetical protein